MEQQRVRKTYKYRLKPTPEQERALERTLMLCRHIYNAAKNIERLGQSLQGDVAVVTSEN
jgi:transposase